MNKLLVTSDNEVISENNSHVLVILQKSKADTRTIKNTEYHHEEQEPACNNNIAHSRYVIFIKVSYKQQNSQISFVIVSSIT